MAELIPANGSNPAVSAAPLPPLPNLPAAPMAGGAGAPAGAPGFLSAILSGIAPVKSAVDQIQMACRQIVQSGSVPGGEQICAQIVALAASLLPVAAQNAVQNSGMGAGGPGMGMGGLSPLPPPPGGPQPIGGFGAPPVAGGGM